MTAPGPLARKLAEVEAEAERLRGVAHGFVDEIAELTAERDHLVRIALRLALTVARDGDLAHRHTDTCHEKYVGCLAARVIAERAP